MPKRRTFSREFKLAAVKKIIEQGLSYAACDRRSLKCEKTDLFHCG
ncbi:hypothetical protein Enr8_05130 [Blastopirellula retiformator]|uniref:Transposase n=1 Tax=Blastopirellula retiformator TaxID=2527970 RepID=A0A5C5VM37_9BACT|nr:hypothetical protein Enr8_05130 [Blastopirellula retiformator]